MSRDGTALDGSETDESLSDLGRETPSTQYQIPMVSPGSVESTASVETVRPTNAPPGTTTKHCMRGTDFNCVGASSSAAAAPRSPMLRRQPSAPSTLQHITIPPNQQAVPPVVSPRLPPVSESRHG